MNTFKSALAICGLSNRQAAGFFDVRPDTVNSWTSGRNAPPEGVWVMLADLYASIERTADLAAIELDGVDPRQWGNIQADSGDDPLPDGADSAAGAMALLLKIRDDNEEASE